VVAQELAGAYDQMQSVRIKAWGDAPEACLA
jgi:hypothetical protein